jgi:hypothetical protein
MTSSFLAVSGTLNPQHAKVVVYSNPKNHILLSSRPRINMISVRHQVLGDSRPRTLRTSYTAHFCRRWVQKNWQNMKAEMSAGVEARAM